MDRVVLPGFVIAALSALGTALPADVGAAPAAIEVAPYVATWSWPSLAELRGRGVGAITLAFVLADRGCVPTLEIARRRVEIDAFRAAGGQVRASLGGAAGTPLEVACPDAAALAGAVSGFVERTGITDLDLDVEPAEAMTPGVNRRRAEAMRALQVGRGVTVGLTLAATPAGLSPSGIEVLRAMLRAGVRLRRVNLMTMELGGDRPMGELAILALTSAHGQLRALVPALSEAEAWGLLGATPMVGPNRSAGQAFTLADARTLAAFARRRHLGALSYWAVQRDRGLAFFDVLRLAAPVGPP